MIDQFISDYQEVGLHMHQGTPLQIAELASDGQVDFAIATEALEHFSDLVMLPCYRWNRCIVVPKGHPLLAVERITLADVAAHPIVTYVFGFTGRSKLDDAFDDAGLEPRVVFTATDADVIKTYVRLGLGIGIMAKMAFDEAKDDDLVAIDASHLFESSTTMIGCRRGTFLRGYMYEFMQLFAQHLTKERVVAAFEAVDQSGVDDIFSELTLPLR